MTAHIFGGIQGMTDAQVRQAYAECRARNAKLEEALLDVVDELQIRLGDASTKSGQRAAQKLAKARAILAKETAP